MVIDFGSTLSHLFHNYKEKLNSEEYTNEQRIKILTTALKRIFKNADIFVKLDEEEKYYHDLSIAIAHEGKLVIHVKCEYVFDIENNCWEIDEIKFYKETIEIELK